MKFDYLPDYLPSDTRLALEELPVSGCSRSLYFDRFAQPAQRKEARNSFFNKGFKAHRAGEKIVSWNAWLGHSGFGFKPARLLVAELQSRLMVNMAGGVMENAGLCLDRFGVPYIPGSAIKGCARRMAIQKLWEAREANESPGLLARLLADLALVFGWGEQDWTIEKNKNGKFVSDFVYAVDLTLWQEVSSEARNRLPQTDHFAGAISFLPAFPHTLPEHDLQLDVLTCHHSNYYEQPDRANKRRDWDDWNRNWGKAPDTEEPNPVVFPTIAGGIVFQFPVQPVRRERDSFSQPGSKLTSVALAWLGQSLELFGLGAKTAAGYGWFNASPEFNERFAADLRQKALAEAKRLADERAANEARQRHEMAKAQRANLKPDDQWMAKFKSFPEGKRRELINKFAFDDEKWWMTEGELAAEVVQLSLLHFLLAHEPDFLAADRAKTSTKIAKAIAALKRKYPSQSK